MVQRVFHKGLQAQLLDPAVQGFGLRLDLIVQDIGIAHFLNIEIALDAGQLLLKGHHCAAFAEDHPEKPGEGLDHLNDLLLIPGLRQPDDDLQRVVEKVGIDLFLKQPQLQLLLGAGVLLHFFHQALEFCRHAVEALVEDGDLILPGIFHQGIKVALRQPPGVFHQRLDGVVDGPVDAHQQKCQNRHHQHHRRQIPQQQQLKSGLEHLINGLPPEQLQINVFLNLVVHQGGDIPNLLQRHILQFQGHVRINLLPQLLTVPLQGAEGARGNLQLDPAVFRIVLLLQQIQPLANFLHVVEELGRLQGAAPRHQIIGVQAHVIPDSGDQLVCGNDPLRQDMVFSQKVVGQADNQQVDTQHPHQDLAPYAPTAAQGGFQGAGCTTHPSHSVWERRYWLGVCPVFFLNSMLKYSIF